MPKKLPFWGRREKRVGFFPVSKLESCLGNRSRRPKKERERKEKHFPGQCQKRLLFLSFRFGGILQSAIDFRRWQGRSRNFDHARQTFTVEQNIVSFSRSFVGFLLAAVCRKSSEILACHVVTFCDAVVRNNTLYVRRTHQVYPFFPLKEKNL